MSEFEVAYINPNRILILPIERNVSKFQQYGFHLRVSKTKARFLEAAVIASSSSSSCVPTFIILHMVSGALATLQLITIQIRSIMQREQFRGSRCHSSVEGKKSCPTIAGAFPPIKTDRPIRRCSLVGILG